MDLALSIRQELEEFARRKAGREITDLKIEAGDAWSVDISFTLAGRDRLQLRNLRDGDVPLLLKFGQNLGDESRELFGPYPWDDAVRLPEALGQTIRNAVDRVDASYLMLCEDEPIAHFFLWKAGGNAQSAGHGVQVPELGIAIADGWHGRGLGRLIMRLLDCAAASLGAAAIELTTAFGNEAGYRTYLSAGYVEVGEICVPRGVDVTAAVEGSVSFESYKCERQMVRIIDEAKRQAVEKYLAAKRIDSEAVCRGKRRAD